MKEECSGMNCPHCESKEIEVLKPVKPIKIRPNGSAYHRFKCKDCACEWEE